MRCPILLHEKNIRLFTSHKVYTETEMRARYEILTENYSKVLHIEALTMVDMARKDILPAVSRYVHELADTAAAKKALSASLDCRYEEETGGTAQPAECTGICQGCRSGDGADRGGGSAGSHRRGGVLLP